LRLGYSHWTGGGKGDRDQFLKKEQQMKFDISTIFWIFFIGVFGLIHHLLFRETSPSNSQKTSKINSFLLKNTGFPVFTG